MVIASSGCANPPIPGLSRELVQENPRRFRI
jgi:hypothetical protein